MYSFLKEYMLREKLNSFILTLFFKPLFVKSYLMLMFVQNTHSTMNGEIMSTLRFHNKIFSSSLKSIQ
jgi:hypothetical protein